MKPETKHDNRRRINKIIQWWGNHDSNFTKAMYNEGVRDVSDDDLKNEPKSYFGKFKKDLVYTGLEVRGVLYFLMNTQSKTGNSGSGKLKSYEDARKYFDTIKWGATVANHIDTSIVVLRFLICMHVRFCSSKWDSIHSPHFRTSPKGLFPSRRCRIVQVLLVAH